MNKQIVIPVIAILTIGTIVMGYFLWQQTNKLGEAEAEIVSLEGNVVALQKKLPEPEPDPIQDPAIEPEPVLMWKAQLPFYVIGGQVYVRGFRDLHTALERLLGFRRIGLLGGHPLVTGVERHLEWIRASNTIFLISPADLEALTELARKYPELLPLSYDELKLYSPPFMYVARDQETGMIRVLVIAHQVPDSLAKLLIEGVSLETPIVVFLSAACLPPMIPIRTPTPDPEVAELQNQITALEKKLSEREVAIQVLQSQVEEKAKRIQDLERQLELAIRARDEVLVHRKTVVGEVDPYGPSINLAALGVPIDLIDVFKLEKKGDQRAIPLIFSLVDNRVFIGSTGDQRVEDWLNTFIGLARGSNILELDQEYILKVYTVHGQIYQISFRTGGLPTLANISHLRQIILVPAMPEKGFYWPYLLAVPNTRNMAESVGHRRYLMVDINNTGATNDYDTTVRATKDFISRWGFVAVRVANALWSPMLVPVFPRPWVGYTYWGEHNSIYTHALDRDTAIMHLKMQDPNVRPMLIETFARYGFDVHRLVRLDLQLIAMMDHAIGYLNQQGFNLEPTKVFLYGYSASGTFVDRFTAFHPERVKAVASGATLDDMILPLAQYRGQQLIFPIGIYDYEEITGRKFSLERHNQVARLIHMGEKDTNDVLPFGDCYGDRERRIITELFGVNMLARARYLTELYSRSGGHGMFILDRGMGHWESGELVDFIIEFFRANRDTDTPVYILPPNPAQLMYTLFR